MQSFNDTLTITLKNNVVELQIGGYRSSWEASWLQACKNNGFRDSLSTYQKKKEKRKR